MADFDDNRFNSKKQEYETPQNLFDYLHTIFNFDIDLAADENNKKCEKYFSKDDDALKQSWKGIGWLNPPYGERGYKLKDWVKKSFHESQKSGCVVVMLIPARTNTAWWHDYCMQSKEIMLIKGRPKFKGCKHGLPQPLAIVVFDTHNKDTKLTSLDLKCLSD